ncbi:MAG: hypothetical protein U9P68_00345 [Pseudomonadota bacterium]|nr:hypothetical protein [Pseudomonadota bacterium]
MNHERIRKLWRLLGDRYPSHCAVIEYTFAHNNPTEEGLLILPDDESAMTPEAHAAEAYHSELLALSDDALDERITEADRLANEAKEAAHPFNVPEAMADDDVYDYWSKAAYWSVEEAVALVLGRNPRAVIKKRRAHGERKARFHPDLCGPKFEALYELAQRAVSTRQIRLSTPPGMFLAWAKRNRIAAPERLEAIVRDHGIQVADWKTAYDRQVEKVKALESRIAELEAAPREPAPASKSQSAVTRERNTLLKLVLGLAMDCHGYRPHAPRSSTAGEIASALEVQGITVSEDTIRKYLGEAAEFAPPADA